ncbi:MAG: transketolase [Planctomycetota bacterium]
MSFSSSVHAKAAELTKLAVEMTTAAGAGHPTSAASLAHIVTVLLYQQMRFDPAEPDDAGGDRLVLSEGHACPIVYAAAADIGMAFGSEASARRRLTRSDLLTLREIDSALDGHPNPAVGFPFFPAATGSLGQGLSIAAGIALGARLNGSAKRVFCLIGDGESREGQIAEALDFIVDYDLRAVCPIFNCNGYGQADTVSPQQGFERLSAKLQAAGYNALVIDGHDPLEIRKALEVHAAAMDDRQQPPVAVVARTVKGWGFVDVVGNDMHGKVAKEAQQKEIIQAIDRTARALGSHFSDDDLVRRASPAAPVASPVASSPPSDLEAALRALGQEEILEKGSLAPRKAYGVALRVLGRHDPRVVALDGDVRNSTYSDKFHDDPELRARFFECKIAEQNMVSCAGGLASEGKIPFLSTFGKFLVRAYDQAEMALISGFALKMTGSHVGASVASDGPSQMALSDVAFFRALSEVKTQDGYPLVYLLNPADAFSAYALTLAMAKHPGACYMRTMRPDVPFLYDSQAEFYLGGHRILSEGRDMLLAATGFMVHEARRAGAMLEERGLEPTVLDLYSLPLDGAAIAALARANHGCVLTVEDNYGAAFGSAVAEALAAEGNGFHVHQMFVRTLPKSGRTPEDVLEYLRLSPEDIAEAAISLLDAPDQPAPVEKNPAIQWGARTTD